MAMRMMLTTNEDEDNEDNGDDGDNDSGDDDKSNASNNSVIEKNLHPSRLLLIAFWIS